MQAHYSAMRDAPGDLPPDGPEHRPEG